MSKYTRKKDKNIFLQILKYVGIAVGILLVLVAGGYLYLRFALGIDVFDIKSKFELLKKPVNEVSLVDNAFDRRDAESAFNKMFGENTVYQQIGEEYVFDKEEYLASSLVGDAGLEDKEFASVFDLFAKNFFVGEDNNFNDYFSLLQVSFSNFAIEGDVSSSDVKVVAKIDFSSLKRSLSAGIGLTLFAKLLPNSIYLTNTFTLSVGDGTESNYEVTLGKLLINQLSEEESNGIVGLIGKLLGEETFSQRAITDLFSESLFSSSEDNGLLSTVGGLQNFVFSDSGDKVVIVLKKA